MRLKMNEKTIAQRVARSFVASRGNQVRRKDKDLMSDTGGVSKGRDREPHKKPPRDDVKNRHREKRKTKGELDSDTQSDPDMKKSSVHPLDRKAEGWGGLELPEYNYYRDVWANLCDIIRQTGSISEKDFKRNEDIRANVDALLRKPVAMEVVDRMNSMGMRSEFCAECLYSRMEETGNG
jgi:hypothetical protein